MSKVDLFSWLEWLMLHKDILVVSLLGLLALVELIAYLTVALLPPRITTWRRRLWRRRRRGLQSVLGVAILASLFLAYRFPASPPGSIERWIQNAEISIAELADEGAQQSQRAERVEGRVFKVIDGDSLLIRLEGGEMVESRLKGLDAPEYSQTHGSAAKRALSWKLLWRRVEVDILETDRYGRKVVVVHRNGRNINREMVCEGHAWWYARYAPAASDLKRCEAAAREQGLGLWKESKPVPPWMWRRMNPIR